MKKVMMICVRLRAALLSAVLTISCIPARAALTDAQRLVPLGTAAGIRLETEGVLVVGLSGVQAGEETVFPARDAGILEGDMLRTVNGAPIHSAEELQSALEQSAGPVQLELLRDGEALTLQAEPVPGGDGKPRLGVWIRDSVLGIGTLTFYDPETGAYGALGHGIGGKDAGGLLEIRGGELLHAEIGGVKRSASGDPGELQGSYEPGQPIGSISANTEAGIFGVLYQAPEGKTIPVAPRDAVHLGDAKILTCIEGGEAQTYSIRICALYHTAEAGHRDMLIEVTDRTLLEKTGGIVQGMSGSPILQDGAIVGAVTHVLVNNPAKGYGIRIEHMLEAADADAAAA